MEPLFSRVDECTSVPPAHRVPRVEQRRESSPSFSLRTAVELISSDENHTYFPQNLRGPEPEEKKICGPSREAPSSAGQRKIGPALVVNSHVAFDDCFNSENSSSDQRSRCVCLRSGSLVSSFAQRCSRPRILCPERRDPSKWARRISSCYFGSLIRCLPLRTPPYWTRPASQAARRHSSRNRKNHQNRIDLNSKV